MEPEWGAGTHRTFRTGARVEYALRWTGRRHCLELGRKKRSILNRLIRAFRWVRLSGFDMVERVWNWKLGYPRHS
jgi:hypothetical protein